MSDNAARKSPLGGGGNLAFTLGIVFVAALGGFLFGFDTAVINGAVPVLQGMYLDADSGFAGGLPLTAEAMNTAVGLAVAMALAGAAVGAFTAGPISDKIGRKKAMVIAAVLFLASAIGSGLPLTIWDFSIWRILGGIAFGAASVLAPAYIAEVSPAKIRGRLGSLQQLAIVIGIFVALVSNLLIARNAGGAAEEWLAGAEAWRWMFWIEVIPAALYGLLALGIPESPRYLAAQDRDSEAREVLKKVLGPEAAETKITEIHQSLAADHKPRLGDILAKGRGFVFLPIVWLGIGLSVFQQFVGINVVFYYSNLLWESVGLTEEQAFLNTAIGGATNVLTTFIAIALVDKVGRKPLLLAGSLGMTVALATMAIVLGTAGFKTNAIDVDVPEGFEGPVAVSVISTDEEGAQAREELTLDIESEPGTTIAFDFSEAVPNARDVVSVRLEGLPEAFEIEGAEEDGPGVYVIDEPSTQPDLRGNRGVIALVALNLFIIAFGFSWGPIVWVMLGEMFANQIRGAGLAVAAAAQWAANFLISMTFPIMASALGLGFAYGFYTLSALVSLIFVAFLIPETKGKELEQMGELQQGVPARK